MDKKKILNISHRGASDLALENSFNSIEEALKYNVDAIEFDIRTTMDHRPILMHDPTLNRTTQHSGYIRNYNLNEISKFKLTNGEAIPTLEQALDAISHKARAFLDIKDPLSMDFIIEQIKERDLKSCFVFSDDPKILLYLKKQLPELTYGILFHALMPHHPNYQKITSLLIRTPETLYNFFKYFKEIEPSFISLGSYMVSKSFIRYWKDTKKLDIFVWGKNNTEAKMRKLIRKNIDGIVTNRPDILDKILNENIIS